MLNVKPHHFVIFILAAPYEKQSAYSAYHFAKALLAKGHFLDAVFFYSDGVMVANPLLSSEQNNLFELCLKQHFHFYNP